MRIFLGKSLDMLGVSVFVLAMGASTPAFAPGGGPTQMDSFDGPGDLGAHFSGGGSSYPTDYTGNRAGSYGSGYPGYYNGNGNYAGHNRRYRCTPAFAAQNPGMCR